MRIAPGTILLAAALVGCKSTAPKAVQLEDISPTRVERQQQAVERFQADRGEAEFYAALNDWEQGEVEACQQRLTGILARQPDHSPAALLLAETHLATGRLEPADELLTSAASADEQNRLAAGLLALRYNQPRLTIQLLQAASPEQVASPARLRALGVAYYRCGDYAAAEVALQKALDLDNASALAYFLLGCTQSRLDQTAQAEAAFAQAARLDARFSAAR